MAANSGNSLVESTREVLAYIEKHSPHINLVCTLILAATAAIGILISLHAAETQLQASLTERRVSACLAEDQRATGMILAALRADPPSFQFGGGSGGNGGGAGGDIDTPSCNGDAACQNRRAGFAEMRGQRNRRAYVLSHEDPSSFEILGPPPLTAAQHHLSQMLQHLGSAANLSDIDAAITALHAFRNSCGRSVNGG